jgi:hypothetical protein
MVVWARVQTPDRRSGLHQIIGGGRMRPGGVLRLTADFGSGPGSWPARWSGFGEMPDQRSGLQAGGLVVGPTGGRAGCHQERRGWGGRSAGSFLRAMEGVGGSSGGFHRAMGDSCRSRRSRPDAVGGFGRSAGMRLEPRGGGLGFSGSLLCTIGSLGHSAQALHRAMGSLDRSSLDRSVTMGGFRRSSRTLLRAMGAFGRVPI